MLKMSFPDPNTENFGGQVHYVDKGLWYRKLGVRKTQKKLLARVHCVMNRNFSQEDVLKLILGFFRN